MPWREPRPDGSFDAYRILVSELMLQQTQVPRVIPKFISFLNDFPSLQALAAAPLAEVLRAWSGLGYNRRAKYLHEAAKTLQDVPEPWTYEQLVACKGIGPNTAKAVLVYAYDQPEVFIETNIRTVFIHYFFQDKLTVSDAEITAVLERTLDRELPRACYWALMDIGAYIKSAEGNASRKSTAYKKQSPFEGSMRQVRGRVLKLLADGIPKTMQQLSMQDDERTKAVLASLQNEGLIHKKSGKYHLGNV